MSISITRKYHSVELAQGQLAETLKVIVREIAPNLEEPLVTIQRALSDGGDETITDANLVVLENISALHQGYEYIRLAFEDQEGREGLISLSAQQRTYWAPEFVSLTVRAESATLVHKAFELFEKLLNAKKMMPKQGADAEQVASEDINVEIIEAPARRLITRAHSFEKGFLLDEGRLRRIDTILHRRVAHLEGSDIRYHVKRTDGMSYDTASIEIIVNEDNFDSRAIEEIVATHRPESWKVEELEARLKFSKRYGVELSIKGVDEQTVEALNSELMDYLHNDVAILPDTERRLSTVFTILPIVLLGAPFIIMFVAAAIIVVAQPSLVQPDLNAILASDDINGKLNYLIRESDQATSGTSARITLGLFGWLILIGFIMIIEGRIKNWICGLFPHNIFLFGSQIERYEQTKKRQENWKWGIGIAIIVNILAGFLVWFLTR